MDKEPRNEIMRRLEKISPTINKGRQSEDLTDREAQRKSKVDWY